MRSIRNTVCVIITWSNTKYMTQQPCIVMCQMTITVFRITGQLSACSKVCLDWQQRNIKGLRYCPFVRKIHQQLTNGWIPAQRDINTESVSIWWCYNGKKEQRSAWEQTTSFRTIIHNLWSVYCLYQYDITAWRPVTSPHKGPVK